MDKRLFFAAEVSAPWPEVLPKGRLIAEATRHMTLAFLGNTDYGKLEPLLKNVPPPSFKVGISGVSDQLLFLPPKHPRVAACHVDWLLNAPLLITYQKDLVAWLKDKGFHLRDDFLSHVTIARSPLEGWDNFDFRLPFFLKAIHLYESIGDLTYEPLWSHFVMEPFTEFEHTADIAFIIRGETPAQIHLNAQIALAFKFPSLLPYLLLDSLKTNIDGIIMDLNKVITRADQEIGSPLKAISYHGNIEDKQGILTWEMIVDV